MCLYLPYYSEDQNELTQKGLFNRAPDLISVYTGDRGRLDYTFKKINKYPSTKVLISGVYAKNSLKTLLHKQGKDISVKDYLEKEAHHIELDYIATNTVENVLSTLRYLKTLENPKKILIISSDYHIFRIKLLIKYLNHNENYVFYFHGVESNYGEFRSIKLLIKEVYKLFKAIMFLIFWS
ncbi:MAG: YdcF family protein [Bacteriovoracaceae bacterium]|jgi:uncharacterized SAM-binding protein YcdF (DUF218 family)|nr:YdcF family protein [Bacteriovoracaceae bacterium]